MNNILQILLNQVGFIIATIVGVIAHTLAGAIKHRNNYSKDKMMEGAKKYALILSTIVLTIIGINCYEPLFLKFGEDIETLKTAILLVLYGKVFILLKEATDVKDEDMEESKKYNEGNGISK